MVRWRIVLLSVLALPVLALPAPLSAATSPPPASVDSAVQVTTDMAASRAHTVPAVAVDPRNDNTLAIAEADAYSGQCAVHISTNAGLSWSLASTPTVPAKYSSCAFVPFGPVVDVAFGPDGTLYYALGGFDPIDKVGRIFLARSSDLGATWETATLPTIAKNLDKGETGVDGVPSIAVDPQDPKRVYVGWGSNWATYTLNSEVLQGKLYYWDVIERVYVASSSDGGRTFGDPVNVGDGLRMSPAAEGVKPPPQVIAGNNGEVFALFGEYSRAGTRDDRTGLAPPAHIYLATSHDNGKTFANQTIYTQPTPTMTSDWTWVPRGGIDRRNGNLYVAWEQMSASGNPVQISLIRSTDGGKTWSAPTKVNDAVPQRQWNYPEEYPSMSVAPNGRVDVAWYDYRNDPTYVAGAKVNNFQDVYYTYSTDGGQTWAPNIKLTDRLIDRRFGPSTQGGIRGPVGVASRNGAAYVAWDDSRNGNATNATQDIYFTRARLESPSHIFSASGGTSRAAWALLGAAIGVVACGLAMAIGFSARGTGGSAASAGEAARVTRTAGDQTKPV
ncbi:MAG TPA: sialidase family protein [Acidimicrobiales bacterium]|nr:sialidase family protein [Acidimicrobiales bacterium]